MMAGEVDLALTSRVRVNAARRKRVCAKPSPESGVESGSGLGWVPEWDELSTVTVMVNVWYRNGMSSLWRRGGRALDEPSVLSALTALCGTPLWTAAPPCALPPL